MKKITKGQAEAFLKKAGFPNLSVDKAEGVFYLVGGTDDDRINQYLERCLHIVRWSDMTFDVLEGKLEELKMVN